MLSKRNYLVREIVPIPSDTPTIETVSEHLGREYWKIFLPYGCPQKIDLLWLVKPKNTSRDYRGPKADLNKIHGSFIGVQSSHFPYKNTGVGFCLT